MKRLPTSDGSMRLQLDTRHGATLTEVLMSILIMSVGVLSVFSLYPIAVTRSIQATQAVHAKVLLGNAAAEIQSNPNLLNGAPPWRSNTVYRVGDIVTAPVSYDDNFTSSALRFICTNTGTSGLVFPPLQFLTAAATDYTDNDTAVANGGAFTRDLNGNGAVNAGEIVWQRAVGNANVAPLSGAIGGAMVLPTRSLESLVTVIDPYGWAHHNNVGSAILRDTYGTAPRTEAGYRMLLSDGGGGGSRTMQAYNGSPVGTVEGTFQPLFSFAMGGGTFARKSSFATLAIDEELTASQLFSIARRTVELDGSYESDAQAINMVASGGTIAAAATAGRTLITLPASPDVTAMLNEIKTTVDALETADNPLTYRVTVSSPSQGITESRWIVNGFDDDLDGNVDVEAVIPASYSVEVGGLPGALNTASATDVTVRFELFEPRYTWLATIARNANGGVDSAKCVVFFRRSFENAVEVGFSAQFGNDPGDTTDDPEDAGFDPVVAAENRSRAYIFNGRDTDASTTLDATDAYPSVAVGWRVFDSTSGHWYQIKSIVTAPAAGTFGGIYEVELDREVEVIVRSGGGLGMAPGVAAPQAVIPTGVVRIFDLDLDR